MRHLHLTVVAAVALVSAIVLNGQTPAVNTSGVGPKPQLPSPGTSATNFVKVDGWPAGKMPAAPKGFAVAPFGGGLNHPRWLYVLPNGDVLAAEASTPPKEPKDQKEAQAQEGLRKARAITGSANRITLLRDANGDGAVEHQGVFLDGLNHPFGMVLVGATLFVANTDAVMAFPYQTGAQRITAPGKKILDLPAGGYNNHWTRNIIANPESGKLYVSVGSASNIGEHGMAEEKRRANILECNLDGSGARVFANGLRNPNGMDWEPTTGALWTVVNERDMLGDDLVPDYLTRVKDGGFYGWPFSYFGRHVDTRVSPQDPALVDRAIEPDYGLGAHTAALGLAFYRGKAFPAHYRGGAFISLHGSWNRSEPSGYKVIFVPFAKGQPNGRPEDFLSGFLAPDRGPVAYGRPVGVTVDRAGALLVADDAGNRVWRVRASSPSGRQSD